MMSSGSGGGGGVGHSARKRSRANSNLSTPTTPGGGGAYHNRASNNNFILDKNERLLRLNVGGYPFDVVRTSLPLLETMMTDRWLSSCLVDSDGRIFIDRDGDAFGDILRYLRGGSDFLMELVHSYSSNSSAYGGHHRGSAASSRSAMMMSSRDGGGGGAATGGGVSQSSSSNVDRLRRLRTEADYYGLHQLVHDIDVVTVGQKIIFEDVGWARVAAGCRLPNRNRQEGGGMENEQNNNNGNGGGGFGEQNNANNDAVHAGDENNQNLQEEDQEEEEDDNPNNEDQAMDENEDDNIDEDDAEEEEQEQAAFADEDDEEDDEEGRDPNEPLPYKHWSWSKQYGNPDILRPHPTHTSSMIVGEDGSYLLLLRLAAALPSPLARIKWDQEEEEGRRVTRGALRRRRRSRRHRPTGNGHEDDDDDDSEEEDAAADAANDSNNHDHRSKELEEDYFVTVNIEAPLQTVMDSVDESQTHFPLLRAGLWDYRTEEEVLNEDPVFATFCAMECVSLRAGDILSVSFMNEEVSRIRSPFPDNMPAELVNSLTLVRAYGNTLKRYERLKSSPTSAMRSTTASSGWMERGDDARGGRHRRRDGSGNFAALGGGSSSRKSSKGYRQSVEQHDADEYKSPNDDDVYACSDEAEVLEEFDRSLTRTAHWISPRNDFPSTPFSPPLHAHSSVIEFPHPGHYLLLGRVALGCRRDATFHSVLSGGPIEGHRAQLSVRSAGGRLLHAVGFVFEDRPRLEWADLSILSENAMFNDVVHVPQAGTELSITTTGDCRLHPEGTEVGPFCSAVSQSLSCLLLDDEIMEGTYFSHFINGRPVLTFLWPLITLILAFHFQLRFPKHFLSMHHIRQKHGS